MAAKRGKQFPKATVTPVRDMTKVGGSEDTILRMTPALSGGRSTIYRKLGDNEGYPRGYNPAQMQEVRDVEASGMLNIEGEGHHAHRGREEATIRESIARSRINPKETFTDPLKINSTSAYLGAKGQYYHKYDVVANQSDKHKINVSNNQDNGYTITHEIGHYVDRDAIHKGWSLTNPLEIAEHKGKLEGTADAYANKNFVQDPRDVRKRKNNPKNKSLYPALAGLAQHSVPGTEPWSWGKGYLGTGIEAAERGDSRYSDLTSTAELPGAGPRAVYQHPETKAPITGGRIIEYMRGMNS
jgi:hypothetical protein